MKKAITVVPGIICLLLMALGLSSVAEAYSVTPSTITLVAGDSQTFTLTGATNPQDLVWKKNGSEYLGSGTSVFATFNETGIYSISVSGIDCLKDGTNPAINVAAKVTVFIVTAAGSTSLTRGSNATYTATVTPSGLNPTFKWKFTGGGTIIQKDIGATNTWSGMMVASGTIEVSAIIGISESTDIVGVNLSARNWNANVQPPVVNRASGSNPTYPGDFGSAAPTGLNPADINVSAAKIADNGPNNGLAYVTVPPTQHGMIIRINQYLNNQRSGFSLAQGNADDVQAIQVNQGKPNTTAVTAGRNGRLNTTPANDDTIVGTTITTGPNGICNTTKSVDDIQIIPIGRGKPNSTIINAGHSGRLNIAAKPSTDDVTIANYVTSGPNGIANTGIDNRAEVSQAILLSAVETHEGTSGNTSVTSHWTYWYRIEAADIDINAEAEDEIGIGSTSTLKTAVTNKLDIIRLRLRSAWIASPEPSGYLPGGTVFDFIYPDPSFPAY